MEKTIHFCDRCGKALPVEKKNICGLEFEIVKRGRVTQWDISKSKVELCELCAKEIDIELLKFKLSVLNDIV